MTDKLDKLVSLSASNLKRKLEILDLKGKGLMSATDVQSELAQMRASVSKLVEPLPKSTPDLVMMSILLSNRIQILTFFFFFFSFLV